MRFFCCVISWFVSCYFLFCFMPSRVLFHAISCFVSCHFVFCFMLFWELNHLYCSFPSPLLFIRIIKGRGAIKFRIGCIMRVLFIRFVEGRGAIKFRIGCIMRVLFIRFVEGRVTIHFPLFCGVKSIISLLAWVAVIICRKSCDEMMQNTRWNDANCDAKWY